MHHSLLMKYLFGSSSNLMRKQIDKINIYKFPMKGLQIDKNCLLLDLLTITKPNDLKHQQRIVVRKKKPTYQISPLQSANNKRHQSSRDSILDQFQKKLINFIQANQTHTTATNKFLERVGTKESDLLVKVKKNRRINLSLQVPDKKAKKKSIKQYMAEASLQKKRHYGLKSSNSIDVSARTHSETKKSSSVLFIRKVYKRSSTLNDFEGVSRAESLQKQEKMPIHHTKAYFFQRKKQMNTRNSEHSWHQSLESASNADEFRERISTSINIEQPQVRIFHHPLSNTASHIFILPQKNQQDHENDKANLGKIGRKLNSKLLRDGREAVQYMKTEQEEVENDIGPWQRRKTVDSQIH